MAREGLARLMFVFGLAAASGSWIFAVPAQAEFTLFGGWSEGDMTVFPMPHDPLGFVIDGGYEIPISGTFSLHPSVSWHRGQFLVLQFKEGRSSSACCARTEASVPVEPAGSSDIKVVDNDYATNLFELGAVLRVGTRITRESRLWLESGGGAAVIRVAFRSTRGPSFARTGGPYTVTTRTRPTIRAGLGVDLPGMGWVRPWVGSSLTIIFDEGGGKLGLHRLGLGLKL